MTDSRGWIGVLLGMAVASSTASSQATLHVVRGELRDSLSGKPLAGAVVNLRGPASRETRTDHDGQFRFGGLTAGQYHLTVRRFGYAEVEKDLSLMIMTCSLPSPRHP